MKPVIFAFTPVALARRRANGWTPARQRAFIAALARTGHVGRAARAVGLSARSAYRLRDRPDAGEFDDAWEMAIKQAMAGVLPRALTLAREGEFVPVVSKGRIIGRRRRDNLSALLRVFVAVNQSAKSEQVRAEARHDRDYRRQTLANRKRLDAEDAAKARERAEFAAEYDRQIAEAAAASRARRVPRIRFL